MPFNHLSDRVTDGVAVAAVTSPIWASMLQNVSEFAGLIVPILGAIWLLVQIIGYFYRKP
jgi:hypothetical protein